MITLPSLPNYRAEWRPLYFETIPGSGERFTFAVIACGEDGRVDIRDTLRPGSLRPLFGPQGDVMHGLMIRAVLAIKRHLDNHEPWRTVPFILSSIHAGEVRETFADNFEQVFDQAIRLSASLGISTIGALSQEDANADEDLVSWSGRIRSFVEAMKSDLAKNFNHNIREGKNRSIKAKIGFMYGNYAASFGVIHTRSERISADITSIKKKLWDLDRLRDNSTVAPREVEIIVGHAPLEVIHNYPRMVRTLRDKLDTLSHEAANRNISVFKTADVRIAAEHIVKKVATA